jgi:hypothetical protein
MRFTPVAGIEHFGAALRRDARPASLDRSRRRFGLPRRKTDIDRDQIADGKKRLDFSERRSADLMMPGFTKKSSDHRTRRTGSRRDATSAVKMSERLTAAVDAWAEVHDTVRSDAIRQLVELGLSATPSAAAPARCDPAEIEGLAVKRIDQLLDPSLPAAERERRIRRLTEGPPEFSDERIDLPKPK